MVVQLPRERKRRFTVNLLIAFRGARARRGLWT
jgi:hypothetical protein